MSPKKSLQIHLNAIPETGREIELDLGKEWFARWREEDPGLEFFSGHMRGGVRLEKHRQDVLVRGDTAARGPEVTQRARTS